MSHFKSSSPQAIIPTVTAMSTSRQIKSILKKYPPQPSSASPSATATTTTIATTPSPSSNPPQKTFDDHNREIAFYHAQLLQQRKDISLSILLATETLIDYPLCRPPLYTSSSPSPSDAETFKTLILPFTPSDYDDLIEERNINEHCGYALCPEKRVKDGGGGEWRLLGMGGKAKDFRVVRTCELDKWCSEECKRRALWVRVQLSECPAWERAVAMDTLGGEARIELLDEPKPQAVEDQDAVLQGIERLHLDGGDETERGVRDREERDLARERGDTGMGARRGLVDIKILERDIQRKVEPPSLGEEELSGKLEHLALEGYTSKFDDIAAGGEGW